MHDYALSHEGIVVQSVEAIVEEQKSQHKRYKCAEEISKTVIAETKPYGDEREDRIRDRKACGHKQRIDPIIEVQHEDQQGEH